MEAEVIATWTFGTTAPDGSVTRTDDGAATPLTPGHHPRKKQQKNYTGRGYSHGDPFPKLSRKN